MGPCDPNPALRMTTSGVGASESASRVVASPSGVARSATTTWVSTPWVSAAHRASSRSRSSRRATTSSA